MECTKLNFKMMVIPVSNDLEKDSKDGVVPVILTTEEQSSDFGAYMCSCMCSFMCIGILSSLQIAQITIGVMYPNSCKSSFNLNVNVWLIVQGIGGCLQLVINMTMLYKKCLCMCGFSRILLVLFQVIWMIIGSIMFWRDCYNCQPQTLNTMLWVSLILGYISIFIQDNSSRND
jgi:hypothetical protein